jgi:RNA polymerase-interacting CarD/CdnL/TRCF family regulator
MELAPPTKETEEVIAPIAMLAQLNRAVTCLTDNFYKHRTDWLEHRRDFREHKKNTEEFIAEHAQYREVLSLLLDNKKQSEKNLRDRKILENKTILTTVQYFPLVALCSIIIGLTFFILHQLPMWTK